MRRRSLSYFVAVLCAARAAAAPGVVLTISQIGAQFVLDTTVPLLEAALSNVTIPNVNATVDGFYIALSDASCVGFSIGDAVMDLGATQGITVVAVGVSLSCSADWSFSATAHDTRSGASGGATASLASATIVLGVNVTANATSGAPVLAAQSSQLIVGQLDVNFSGGIIAQLLDLFRDLFKTSITNSLASAISTAVSDIINTSLNAVLNSISYVLPLPFPAPYDISEVRFGLAGDPVFSLPFMAFPVLGDVVPVANPVAPPIVPPTLPAFGVSTGASFIQLFLSSYTLQSAIYTFQSAGLLNWTVTSAELPAGLNDTSAYGLIAPGLPLLYPNAPVSLGIALASTPNITIAPSGVYMDVQLNISFIINGATLAFVLSSDTSLNATVAIYTSNATLALHGDIAYANSSLTVGYSSVGPVSAGLLQLAIDLVFDDILVPLINGVFGSGLPLPNVPGISLSNTFLTLSSGFLVLATDFAFAA